MRATIGVIGPVLLKRPDAASTGMPHTRVARRHLIGVLLTALTFGLALSAAAPAHASGDSCEPGWTLDFAAMPECANIAALVPGNDTRANLLLLLADRHGTPTSPAPALQPMLDLNAFRLRFSGQRQDDTGVYASGEGSRCRSAVPGAKAFTAAVEAASSLSADDRRALVEAREALTPQCDGGENAATSSASPSSAAAWPPASLANVTGEEGRAFAAYLQAANAFYAGHFADARSGFDGLRANPDPWLADTAAYMAARTAVNRLQVHAFTDYGTFAGSAAIDQAAAHAAEADLVAYLEKHPDGRYVTSARGLERRVAWLAGWTADLADRYSALIAEPPAARGMDDAALADEIDDKLLPTLTPAMTKDPILLATLDLKAMRREKAGEPRGEGPDLAAQREAFASAPALYEFLVAAAAFYDENSPSAVVRNIADDTRRRGGDHLWFSRQFLRGLALEAGDDRNARGFWKDLLPGATRPLDDATAQLALALDEERRGGLDDAFQAGSPLTNSAMRTILLVHDAGQDLLRARVADPTAAARELQVALFTLLIKELTRGKYRDFLSDVTHVPADAPKDGSVEIDPLGDGPVPLGLFVRGDTAGDIRCPVLAETAAQLAASPGTVRSRLCFAEWLRLNGFDPDHNAVPLTKQDLGFGPSAFSGAPTTRMAVYRSIIAGRAGSSQDRAYALYRAVKCYEPSGYNACGGDDVPKAERRRWYDLLKRDYPHSRWAQRLSFWW